MSIKTFNKPRSRVIQQGDNLYTIMGVYNSSWFIKADKTVDKTRLGYIVKYEGGDHVIQYENKYYICQQIEDIQYEMINE